MPQDFERNTGYTTFYDGVGNHPDSITWKDIFSDFRKKHARKDMEYAMLAGTSLDQADESNMLIKWEKPWLFWRVFLIGLSVIVVIYLMMFAAIRMSGQFGYFSILPVFNLIFIFIPPLIFPLSLMTLFWELNIPRNLSIYQMLLYYLVGGILSLLITIFLGQYIPSESAALAPLSEEPGKFLAAVFFLWLLSRKTGMKIYGLTGLAVGAAVGAGFGGFESVQYAYYQVMRNIGAFAINLDAFQYVAENQLMRGIYALGGHTVYCAPYVAAFALHMKEGKIGLECVFNRDFLITFACSCLMHFLWNSTSNILLNLAIIAALWVSALYITRKCLRQIVSVGRYRSGDKARYMSKRPGYQKQASSAGALTVRCVKGQMMGQAWTVNSGETLTIGRNPDCSVRLAAQEISRRHGVSQKKRTKNKA